MHSHAAADPPTRFLLAGGGTAGHVSPLLALADRLRTDQPDARILVLGTAEGLEASLVPQRGYELVLVPKVPLPRRPSPAALRLPSDLGRAVAAAQAAIRQVQAQVVVGFGGYVAAPAYLAGRRAGVPIVIHEQNAIPGLANRLGACFTRTVGVTFPGTALRHAQLVGMPLRREIAQLQRSAHRAEAAALFDLDPQLPTVLVTGGSLGAARLNAAFQGSGSQLPEAGIQVLHVTGKGKQFQPPEAARARYRVVPYCDRMDLAYSLADLVVARAGANTVCELTAVGLPGIYVPLPIGNGEQRHNAAAVVAAGGGLLVADEQVTPDWVATQVRKLMGDQTRLARMGRAAAAVGHRDADVALARLVLRAGAQQ